jgi:hypothetical protein
VLISVIEPPSNGLRLQAVGSIVSGRANASHNLGGRQWVPVLTSKEDLVNWLGGKPRDVASCIAMRASLRSVPAGLTQLHGLARTATPHDKLLRMFRSLAAIWAIAAFPSRRETLTAVVVASRSGSVSANIERAARFATASTVGESDAVAVEFAQESIDCAIEAIAVSGKQPFRDFLRACATDAEILDQRTSPTVLALSQLWPGGVPPRWCLEDIEELKMLLADGDGWDVWTDWYQDRLNGNTPNQSLEAARVTIPEELWKSPRKANEYIRGLVTEPQIFPGILTEADLERQIFSLSHNEALVVGLRASLRAFPQFSPENPADPELAILTVIRVMSSAWVAALFPDRAPHRIRSNAALVSLLDTRQPLTRAAVDANSYSASDGQSRAAAGIVASAIRELRAQAANQDGRAAGVVFGMAVTDDMNDLQGAAPTAVAQLPLWPGPMAPDWTSQRWSVLKQELISLGVGWEVWVDWYEDRLAGTTRSEAQEFVYVNVPEEMWAEGPARVNTWISRKIEQLQSPSSPIDALPTVPAQQPAAIEPIWSKSRLTLSKTVAKTDLKGRAFTAALSSLREELQTFANDIAHQVNIDKRFLAVVQRLSDQVPRKAPIQSQIFRLGHAETIFAAYANTVDTEWPPVLAAQYHALALHFDRTMRQVPLWREFKRNAAKGTLAPNQIQEAALLATEMAATLRFEETADLVDEIIPHTVEQMADSLRTALAANSETPDAAIEAGAELLAYDVVESVNNILKSIFQAAIWTGIPSTLKKASAKFGDEASKSIINEAGRLGKNVGPALTKWARRTVKVGIGTGGTYYFGKPLILWVASNYPEAFSWLTPVTRLFS